VGLEDEGVARAGARRGPFRVRVRIRIRVRVRVRVRVIPWWGSRTRAWPARAHEESLLVATCRTGARGRPRRGDVGGASIMAIWTLAKEGAGAGWSLSVSHSGLRVPLVSQCTRRKHAPLRALGDGDAVGVAPSRVHRAADNHLGEVQSVPEVFKDDVLRLVS